MPQMSPMNWTFLLIYTLMIIYIYMSMLYFTPMLNYYNKSYLKKYPKIKKKMTF